MSTEKKAEKNLKIVIIFLLVILTVLIILVLSYSRYGSDNMAYASFDAAEFNVSLLGDISMSDLKEDTTSLEKKEFGVTLDAKTYYPGSTEETFLFTVTNGTNTGDNSEIAVQYEITLRTTQNMPFEYKLVYYEEESNTEYTYETDGPVEIEDDFEIGYEYTFYLASENTINGETTDHEEVLFDLEVGSSTDSGLALNKHALIVEWPIEAAADEDSVATNSSVYMKELEIIQVFVTATSINKLADEDYTARGEAMDMLYSSGLLILDPNEYDFWGNSNVNESDEYTYLYTFDYRSFDSDNQYELILDNGLFRGIEDLVQTSEAIYYSANLLVPYDTVTTLPSIALDSDGDGYETLTCTGYYLYNLIDDTYVEITSPTAERPKGMEDELQYKIYAVYEVEDDGLIYNSVPDGSGSSSTQISDQDILYFELEDAEVESSYAFSNKIKVEIKATFGNRPSS